LPALRSRLIVHKQEAVATKQGLISAKTAKAIDQIGINPESWVDELKGFKSIGFLLVSSLTLTPSGLT